MSISLYAGGPLAAGRALKMWGGEYQQTIDKSNARQIFFIGREWASIPETQSEK
jgi:hypothetical protein